MQNLIKKAVLTKRIHKYQRLGKRVIKIEINEGVELYSEAAGSFYLLITPRSAAIYFKRVVPEMDGDRMSVTAFSDYIVRINKFDLLLSILEKHLSELEA